MKVQIPLNFCPFYVKGKRQTARISGKCTVYALYPCVLVKPTNLSFI